MSMLVYVAGPYADAAFVRVVHGHLRSLDITPTSRWATEATGPEDFSRLTPDALRTAATRNDGDIRGSDVLLLLDQTGSGRETYAEARFALGLGKPVVWVGRPILSAFRAGVVRVDDFEAAVAMLIRMRDAHAEGYRGDLLLHLAGAA